ncbi:MAG: hypothetical protein ACOX45_09990 [Acutalibacteraceae bacterium]
MGTWGSSLYANDTTCDVRDIYTKLLQEQFNNEEAYQKTLEKCHEYINDENEPLFWYALAETQWKFGRLMPEVKAKALEWIKKGGGLSLWEESKNSGEGWKQTLHKLKSKLESTMPPEKIIKKPIEFVRNPWNVGDVYAYQFHTDISRERGLFGKYILFQKLENAEWCDGCVLSIVQVFDQAFDELPTLNDIGGVRVLPLTYPPGTKWLPKDKDNYVPSFDSCLRSLMIYDKKPHYPAKHFTFIGNSPVPSIKYDYRQCSDFYWEKDGMDDWLSDYYLCWRNIEY